MWSIWINGKKSKKNSLNWEKIQKKEAQNSFWSKNAHVSAASIIKHTQNPNSTWKPKKTKQTYRLAVVCECIWERESMSDMSLSWHQFDTEGERLQHQPWEPEADREIPKKLWSSAVHQEGWTPEAHGPKPHRKQVKSHATPPTSIIMSHRHRTKLSNTHTMFLFFFICWSICVLSFSFNAYWLFSKTADSIWFCSKFLQGTIMLIILYSNITFLSLEVISEFFIVTYLGLPPFWSNHCHKHDVHSLTCKDLEEILIS